MTPPADSPTTTRRGWTTWPTTSPRRARCWAGAVQGADAVRTIIGAIRTLYDRQEFNFAGPWGDNSFLEDYTAQVRGEPIGCIALVTRNAAGQTQHIAANYRPRSSLLLLSRLLGEKFAGTPIGEHFLAGEA